MTDLAERFARTQGWIYLPSSQTWRAPDGPFRNVAIDVSILPIIWADCKAKGWTVDTLVLPNRSETRIWRDYFADGIPLSFATTNDDPIEALCEAYCKAVESAR